jgi:hypothetical protein
MTFDFDKIAQSKLEFRRRLAAKPVEEKLDMLNELRERLLALRGNALLNRGSGSLKEDSKPYRAGSNR